MNYFQEATNSRRSTILYGPFGRHPHLVKFYLDAIPELEPASDDEPIFWYRNSRLLHVWLEPSFDTVIPPDRWILVLTSHLRLRYDPLSTRVIHCNYPVQKTIPLPKQPSATQDVVVPPTSHTHPFLMECSKIDLSRVQSTHEAYLRLLTLYDVLSPCSEWSLLISEKLRLSLSKDIPGTGPYDSHLLKVLG